MDCWGCRAQHGAERREVIWVPGEDVVAEAYGSDYQVGVDDVGCSGLSEKLSYRAAVVEGMDRDGLEEGREAGLAGPVSPDLSEHWFGGVKSGLGSSGGGHESVGGPFASVDGDEESGVEDHSP